MRSTTNTIFIQAYSISISIRQYRLSYSRRTVMDMMLFGMETLSIDHDTHFKTKKTGAFWEEKGFAQGKGGGGRNLGLQKPGGRWGAQRPHLACQMCLRQRRRTAVYQRRFFLFSLLISMRNTPPPSRVEEFRLWRQGFRRRRQLSDCFRRRKESGRRGIHDSTTHFAFSSSISFFEFVLH